VTHSGVVRSVTAPDPLAVYRGSRVLVSGAAGFIGRWVARLLSQKGANLTAVVRDRDAFSDIAAQWSIEADIVVVDLLNPEEVDRAIDEVSPDIVFNLAGYGVDRSERDLAVMSRMNHALVGQLAQRLSRAQSHSWRGRRLVHAGSALELGLVDGVVREDTTPMPHTEYGSTKLAGSLQLQAVCAETNLDAVTARAFTVFGAGEHRSRLLPTLQRSARDGSAVRLSTGLQRRDFSYVEDVAAGLLRLGISNGVPGEIVNLASGSLTTVREFAERAAHVLGIPPVRLEFGAEPVRADEMRITGVNIQRLVELTGWAPEADLDVALGRSEAFEAELARLSGEIRRRS
jgi:nucleoside-diphosphate-sugar epimerase